MRILMLLTLAALVSACSKEPVVSEKVVRPIAWTQVSTTSLNQIRTLSGIVAPVEAAHLSFEVNGKAANVFVNLGENVEKGQELAHLNKLTFELSLQSAKAQLKQAEASYTEAKNEYERYRKLSEQGLVSKSGFDNSRAAFESSKSLVDVAKAQYDIANKNLSDSVLLAPYNGVITKRMIEPSQQVSAGNPVFEIEGKHGLEVQIMVPETLIRELTDKAELNVHFPVLPNVFVKGNISEIGTRAESANAFPVTVVLQEENDALRAGMTAEADFTFEGVGRTGYQGPTIKVPIDAIGADLNQKAYVFVFDKQSKTITKRFVQTENVINNDVFLSKGLQDGDIIATAGIAFLRDGQEVSLLDTKVQRFN